MRRKGKEETDKPSANKKDEKQTKDAASEKVEDETPWLSQSCVYLLSILLVLGCGALGMLAMYILNEGYLGHQLRALVDKEHAARLMYEAIDDLNWADMEMYIKLGVSPDHKNTDVENTPLIELVHGGHVEGVKTLLKLGANPSLGNKESFTPLHTAAWCSESSANEQSDDLRERMRTKCVPMMKILLDAGANPNAGLPGVKNVRPLHWLVEHASMEGVRLLLENRADVNVELVDGRTPYHVANDIQDPTLRKEMKELLKLYGADTKTRDPTLEEEPREPPVKNVKRQPQWREGIKLAEYRRR